MRLKPGVEICGIQPETVLAMAVADSVYKELFGVEATITAVLDGKHMTGSKHYQGLAFDLRTKNHSGEQLQQNQKELLRAHLASALGHEFDIVIEPTHIHIEVDPKPKKKIESTLKKV